VKLDADAVRRRCQARGVPLTRALREAGVSRTAYYSLLRRDSVLPKTVLRLASALGASPSELLDERALEERRARRRLREARRIAEAKPGAAFETVWHTLILLDEPPLARLNRALRRGRTRTV
jgi:transcriptional regulator with XRE-family HTH domain